MTSQVVRILEAGAVLAQKFWGGGHCPISSVILRSPKPEKLHVGLYLKSVISTVANSVMGWALRPIETKPEGPRAV